jgi:hypothetical protein
MPIVDYEGVRRAEWPKVDFIVGNPPFIGNKHMRTRLGDGYVDALRGQYSPEVSNAVDYVTYWWHRAAKRVRDGDVRRFGLITTNTIRQTQNRKTVEKFLTGKPPLAIAMAVPDHPWVDEGADVRVSMTCVDHANRVSAPRLSIVTSEGRSHEDVQLQERLVGRIHADLTSGADVSSAVPLRPTTGSRSKVSISSVRGSV